MSKKLKYPSVDHHLQDKMSLWLPFSWRSVHSVLQRRDNSWSNFARWTFYGTTYLSLCQILFFSTSDLCVKSVHTLRAKLQAALLSVSFCQSLTTAIAFCRDCPQNRLNVYRQCKMLLQKLSWNAERQIISLPFLDSFIGFPFRIGSATK